MISKSLNIISTYIWDPIFSIKTFVQFCLCETQNFDSVVLVHRLYNTITISWTLIGNVTPETECDQEIRGSGVPWYPLVSPGIPGSRLCLINFHVSCSPQHTLNLSFTPRIHRGQLKEEIRYKVKLTKSYRYRNIMGFLFFIGNHGVIGTHRLVKHLSNISATYKRTD